MAPRRESIVYCLTRDHELAAQLDARLGAALTFFYNDAARLHQALILRAPALAIVDTDAIRPEFGDAGLGPVIHFLRLRAPEMRIGVRPKSAADWLVGAEAGREVTMLPAEREACIEAVVELCGCG
ncbi:MAG: hypothetical protein DLM71_10980 [Chloroflexi bacterium]|nr:MAG: hypothetical protein DLM71_10980 [Chloroflexota bacterium]